MYAATAGGTNISLPEARLFESVDQALKWSYKLEASDIIAASSVFSEMRGGSVKLSKPLSQWENIAQAGLILSLAKRTLNGRERDLMDALYTVPNDKHLKRRKEDKCRKLGKAIHEENHRPKWYMVDIVRSYCKARPHHNNEWWGGNLKLSRMTLWRCSTSNNPQHKSADWLLDVWYGGMISSLDDVFYEMGISG